jgi:hypothetical protein
MPILAAEPTPAPQLTPEQIADAIARLERMQSVGATILSNATQLKNLLSQLDTGAAG